MPHEDRQVGIAEENERNKDARPTKFTSVNGINGTKGTNGISGNTSPPQGRPYALGKTTSPEQFHQHSLPRQNGHVAEYDNRQQPVVNGTNVANGSPVRSPPHATTFPKMIQQEQDGEGWRSAGKRKRSVESPRRADPESGDAQPQEPILPFRQQEYSSSARQALGLSTDRDSPEGRAQQQPLPYPNRDQDESPIYTRTHDSWSPAQQASRPDVDAHLAEHLQRDLQDQESVGDQYDDMQGTTTPDGMIEMVRSYKRTPNGVAHELKPRKRQFANRTKTGCHTCRRRKKKCDEGKPHCQNCLRGNFDCDGYGPKSSLVLARQQGPRLPVPIQAKDGQPFGHPGTYQGSPFANGEYVEGRLPTGPPSAWPEQPWPDASHVAAGNNRSSPPDFRRMPPMDLTRGQHFAGPQDHQRSLTALRYSGAPLAPVMMSGSSNEMAQHALQRHLAASESNRTSEKEKMLTGKHYRHYHDPELLEERQRCAAALERFNNAAKPSAGVGPDERARLFRAIVEPEGPQPVGSAGHSSVIEAPFTCEYGYNINIGDNVVIEKGCVILDPCKIIIGDRVVIGPNVQLLGRSCPIEPALRNESPGIVKSYGSTITIEDDCFIGGGAIILAGRTIKRGSVVGAGTVVNKDVKPGLVVAGNPMRMIAPVPDRPQAQQESQRSSEPRWTDRPADGRASIDHVLI